MFVYFVGDEEMGGPASRAEWAAAIRVASHVLGLGDRHKLSRYIIDLFPEVRDLRA